MCQPKSAGGRRCASATRPNFESAMTEIGTATSTREQVHAQAKHMGDVVAHTATRAGAAEVAALIDADLTSGSRLVDYLRSCQSAATALNEKYEAVEAAIAQQVAPDTYFHATTVRFKPGDELVPGAEIGTRNFGSAFGAAGGGNEHVYLTSESVNAYDWGVQAAKGRKKSVRVYEVEAVAAHTDRHDEFVAASARIVRDATNG